MPVPIRIRSVVAAIAAAGVKPSRVSRVSATQIESNPLRSARCASFICSSALGAPEKRIPFAAGIWRAILQARRRASA